MRALVPILAVLALAQPAAAAKPWASLAIAVHPKGVDAGVVRRYRLRCGPAAGTVPRPGRACLALARLRDPFAPVPRDRICAQIALGPQEALVTGTLRGRNVRARLTVRDSCEIDRWGRLRLVVPGFPGRG